MVINWSKKSTSRIVPWIESSLWYFATYRCFFHVAVTLVAVLAEKQHQQFTSGIEQFPKKKLNRTLTAEKNSLPNSEGNGQCSEFRSWRIQGEVVA